MHHGPNEPQLIRPVSEISASFLRVVRCRQNNDGLNVLSEAKILRRRKCELDEPIFERNIGVFWSEIAFKIKLPLILLFHKLQRVSGGGKLEE